MKVLLEKIKEVLFAVLPVTIIVLLMHFTIVPLENIIIFRFLIGALFIVVGLSVFLLGVDLSVSPVGALMGNRIAKSNKVIIVIVAGLILGFFISIAEPDLHILAGQVSDITGGLISKVSLVAVVSAGIAVILAIGLLRIVFNIPLFKLLIAIYSIILILAILTSREFLAIAFDASGATTGAMTVPFILALALGVSSLKKDSKASEKDSFGLVGIASGGAIIAVLVMSIINRTDKITGTLEHGSSASDSVFLPFFHEVPKISLEVLLALSPIVMLFVIFQLISFKLSRKSARRIIIGFVFAYTGLVVFLTGVNAGFMDAGSLIGSSLASSGRTTLIVIVGFVLGFVTILAEPAVYVLTHQIEDVTSGYVKRRLVLITLSIGVGIAVALSMLRIVTPGLALWHYLLPGYIIATGLMYFTPKLFVGIAYDSGGVASGPMTATFILAFSHGVAFALEGADVVADGFGMIAMVAMTPVIALQILGIIFRLKSRKGGIS